MHCSVTDPTNLWNTFRASICDDLRYRLQSTGHRNVSEEDVFDYGLHLLDDILRKGGHSLAEYPMPQPTRDWERQMGNPLIVEQLDYDRENEQRSADTNLESFNTEQREAYNAVVTSISQELGHRFFLSGPGGTGKTFVYNTICHAIRAQGGVVLAVASSGIAALLIKGGRTAHFMFKIPIELSPTSRCNVSKNSERADLLRQTSVII
ncbi:hypothetical protein BDN72DRAFT_782819, partial [Pluteus cervinus]